MMCMCISDEIDVIVRLFEHKRFQIGIMKNNKIIINGVIYEICDFPYYLTCSELANLVDPIIANRPPIFIKENAEYRYGMLLNPPLNLFIKTGLIKDSLISLTIYSGLKGDYLGSSMRNIYELQEDFINNGYIEKI